MLQPSRTCQLGLQPPAQRNKAEPGGKDKTLKSGDAETLKLSAENVSIEGTLKKILYFRLYKLTPRLSVQLQTQQKIVTVLHFVQLYSQCKQEQFPVKKIATYIVNFFF